ncbi:5-(carboxyamino)imidazole ribonucleotide mutase [Oceanicoccus sp. KOV_DT_Chl]|uniref:5-(carboxyamino)imidazole ribonucleotide mutase n=1 Tax=Oceanicoccus sp. KOV_DT_Chl TaxID=1904639 RepID=UPI000C7C1043|nr:5-(carboxyamino)imidazole ribonucleotide mutase [Oceanicoccus sp. KOV_DT_Chl]
MSHVEVAIIMGSQSDWPTMQCATVVLDALGVSYSKQVVSAHRTPDRLTQFCQDAEKNGIKVIIAGGGAAHLPGMAAANTWLPVIGVPVQSKALNGIDSLLSIAQMPKGVAVATQAIGESGAFNAGLMAAQILATSNQSLQQRLISWRKNQTDSVPVEVE